MRALTTTLLRHLDLAQPTANAGRRFVSAASGLARLDGRYYFVADDELEIFWCEIAGNDPVLALPALGGILPTDAVARKAVKPDFESLATLPRGAVFAERPALLALPSGSTERRMTAILVVPLGGPDHHVTRVDCAPFLSRLRQQALPQLNIEGAMVAGEEIVLLHRGVGASPNALIKLEAAAVYAQLRAETPVLPVDLRFELTPVALGSLSGVRLGFTDGAMLTDGRFLFSAAAEATNNAYDDGEVTGSVLGFATLDGKVSEVFAVEAGFKIEGLHAELLAPSGEVHVRMVTDADDAALPSQLRAAVIPARL